MGEQVRHAVRPATSGDLDRLSQTLAAAFSDDPAFCHLLPPGVRARDDRLRRAFTVDGKRSLRRGGLWTTAAGDAAAVWFPPGAWRPTPGEEIRETPAWVRIAGRRMLVFQRLRSALFAHHRELPPHWYLYYLGARPDRQGQGLGSALLEAVLDRCDADGLPAYLESTCERNLTLYRRHGFEEQGPLDLPPGCPPLTPMWRDPR